MMQEAKPADTMRELPTETREFLAKLEPSDLEALHEAALFWKRVSAFGIVLKWLAIFLVAVATGIVAFGESISKIISWLSK